MDVNEVSEYQCVATLLNIYIMEAIKGINKNPETAESQLRFLEKRRSVLINDTLEDKREKYHNWRGLILGRSDEKS